MVVVLSDQFWFFFGPRAGSLTAFGVSDFRMVMAQNDP